MELRFAKMHGAANDFVILQQAPPPAPRDAELVRALCDRRRGVGADGALFMERLQRKRSEDPVFRMHFYNNDGSRCQMCFNGARCCALRAARSGWSREPFSFLTDWGPIRAQVDEVAGRVRLWFPPPQWHDEQLALPAGSIATVGHPVNTGDPHLVVEVDEESFDAMDFESVARPLRWWTEKLPEGANVHLVQRGPERWRIRSYERGVEGETWACGSGCIATVAALAGGAPRAVPVLLRTHGGDDIAVQPLDGEWMMEGPAVEVFEAVYRWEDEH